MPMHVVDQFRIELQATNQRLTESAERRLREYLETRLEPELDALFDRLDPDASLRLDRIEVDLGPVSISGFESALREALKDAISAVSAKKHAEWVQSDIGQRFLDQVSSYPAYIDPRANSHQLVSAESQEQSINAATEYADALLNLFQTGRLPWWFPSSETDRLFNTTNWNPESIRRFRERFSPQSSVDPACLQRLLLNLQPYSLHRLLHASDSILRDSTHGISKAAQTHEIQENLRSLIDYILKSSSEPKARSWASAAISVASKLGIPINRAQQEDLASLTQNISEDDRDQEQGSASPRGSSAGDVDHDERDNSGREWIQQPSNERTEAPPAEDSPSTSETQDPAMVDGTSIANAGLVLLHPFIPSLFRELDFVDETGRPRDEQRWRAVQTLQYLVLGDRGFPEHTVILEKHLLGIPAPTPAEFPELTVSEEEAADAMILAAIEHWTVLKNTSPQGFRETFLQRHGVLRINSESDQDALYVEKLSLDVLLSFLPWSLSPVFFKWMPKPLFVQWGADSTADVSRYGP